MLITIKYYHKKNYDIDYNKPAIEKFIQGKNAAECMDKIKLLKQHHDLSKYSKIEIIDVQD